VKFTTLQINFTIIIITILLFYSIKKQERDRERKTERNNWIREERRGREGKGIL